MKAIAASLGYRFERETRADGAVVERMLRADGSVAVTATKLAPVGGVA